MLAALRAAGLQVLATTLDGEVSLDDAEAAARRTGGVGVRPRGARACPRTLAALADRRVTIPMAGGAESLNVAAAAAICLYESAKAQRRRG